jgi:hypothetical protein
MISIQDCQRFVLIHANEENGAQVVVRLEQTSPDRSNLGLEGSGVDALLLTHTFGNFDDGESSWCKITPLGARKHSDLFQVRIPDLNLIPLRSLGKLFPQGKVANVE